MTSQLLKVEEREMGLHNDLSDFSKWNYFLDFLFFVFLGLFILLSVSHLSFAQFFLAHLHHLSPQFIHYFLLSENLSALVLSTSTSFPLFSVFCCFFFFHEFIFFLPPASFVHLFNCQHMWNIIFFVYFINPTYWAISSPSLIRKLGTNKGPES